MGEVDMGKKEPCLNRRRSGTLAIRTAQCRRFLAELRVSTDHPCPQPLGNGHGGGRRCDGGSRGRGRDELELSPCTEQLPAPLPLQHLIFQLFFPV